MVKRQKTVGQIKEMTDDLRRYAKDPPSPEKVKRVSREKELLEEQYNDVIEELDFLPRKSLPEKIGLRHLYFEEQLEKAEDGLGRLGRKTGVQIPDRLGFKMEKPESREELAILLSQVAAVKELITITIGAGVNHISSISPLPLTEDRFVKVSGKDLLEELDIELSLRADLAALIKLLHQLTACPHFFTVKEVKLTASSPIRRETTSARREVTGRRGRRGRGRELVDTVEKRGSTEKAVERELEARILISTQLLLEEN